MEMDGAGAGGGLRARNELARFSSFFFVCMAQYTEATGFVWLVG